MSNLPQKAVRLSDKTHEGLKEVVDNVPGVTTYMGAVEWLLYFWYSNQVSLNPKVERPTQTNRVERPTQISRKIDNMW